MLQDYACMKDHSDIPRASVHSERVMLALLPGSKAALERLGKASGFDSVSSYLRGLAEREIRDALPEDYKTIKGVG